MEDVAISPLVQPDRQVAGLHIAGASVIVTLLHLPTQERMCVSYVACSGCPCAQTAYTANAAGVGTVAGNGGDNLPRITSVPVRKASHLLFGAPPMRRSEPGQDDTRAFHGFLPQ